jgi:nitrite reductase (NO-forming)
MSQEWSSHVLFNGHANALTTIAPLTANVGETVRIYFGVGGPNLVSSFHVIGEIFSNVFSQGDLVTIPGKNIQTTLVAPGGSTVVDMFLEVPGTFILVDHALGRAFDKGCIGFLNVAATTAVNSTAVYQNLGVV